MDAPSSPVLPTQEPNATNLLNPNVEIPPQKQVDKENPIIVNKKKKKKRIFKDATAMQPSSSSSSSSSTSVSSYFTKTSMRLSYKRRSPKVVLAPVRRRGGRGGSGGFGDGDVQAIALPLGMSFAAVIAQVLERKDAAGQRISVDHLSRICTFAVKESLANVFGDKFDFFARNFEKSFGSTLSTLRLINESYINKGAYHLSHQNVQTSASDATVNRRVGCATSSSVEDCHSETDFPTISTQSLMHITEEVEGNVSTDCLNQELALHGRMNQLACVPRSVGPVINQLSTIEKSVMELARSNDLKTLEIGLTMKKLKLKEEQLALNFDSNHLERSKLAMGISKASFKAEKFKTELEDARHAELLKKCIDCLVAGLFIMSASLLYGAYIYSYKKITEATASCTPSIEESKSWWIPKPFSSFNSGLHIFRCQVQVVSRMLFGILMVLAVAYLLLQRSATSQRTMPITFILLLLGVACGFAGKLCVDTLGGNGSHWLLYWETLCLLQFFSNVCTSTLFHILYGPVPVSQGIKSNTLCPYWFRQCLFYAIVLLFLPLCCGLLPFASPDEWKDHFLLLATDFLWIASDGS